MDYMVTKIQTIVKRLPLMAAILGAGLAMANKSSSVQKIPLVDDLYAFEYAPSTSSVSQVQNKMNWSHTNNTELCDDVENRPCKILVTRSSIDSSASGIVLNSAFSITATSSSGGAYVSSISDGAGVISNKN